jgi:hypothetical protein
MTEIAGRLAVFLLLPLGSLFSQETEDIKPILAEIEKAGGLKEHPEANALIVFEETNVSFQESGEFTSKEHSLVKILTDKGKQMFASRKLPYHRRYSTVNVLLARVIKPDGRVVPVPKEIIYRILKVASRSPSYTNTQPWEVAVVSGEKREQLCKILYKMAELAEEKADPLKKLAAEFYSERYQRI